MVSFYHNNNNIALIFDLIVESALFKRKTKKLIENNFFKANTCMIAYRLSNKLNGMNVILCNNLINGKYHDDKQ